VQDGFDVLGREPDPDERCAIDSFLAAVRLTPAYAFTLSPGEVSCMLNRRTLHSRTQFSDPDRWLIRVRLNNAALSNSDEDATTGWAQSLLEV
jgi:alpha-ketoglutarate-dependent taurine dioxygenase